jgi:hypothetical protein
MFSCTPASCVASESPRVAEAARRDQRDAHLVGRARDEDQPGDVVLAGVAGALEAVDAHGVAAELLGLDRVPDGRALVDHADARLLEPGHERLRTAARRLDDLDAALDDGGCVVLVRDRAQGRQHGEVHAEGSIGQLSGAIDLLHEIVGRGLRQRGQESEGAGVGYRGDQLGAADPLHATHHDGMLDAELFGEAGLDHGVYSVLGDCIRCCGSRSGRHCATFESRNGQIPSSPPEDRRGPGALLRLRDAIVLERLQATARVYATPLRTVASSFRSIRPL